MKVEHFALQVPEPVAMGEWYQKHLGCRLARAGGAPAHARFLLESQGSVLLEIYRNPTVPVPDYSTMNPLSLHLAFLSDDLRADRDRLVGAGARLVEDVNVSSSGDQFLMLRDPWGLPLQFVKRASPMLP